ncbi:DEAD/DEAH box helicase [Pseudidiomarina aestuarii]|uniref:DEAD/DEAH box helicase n=1 Tax=Pseudidiomarina aestuarii TaxID=624146 RepID=A0A7Z6ZS39_9GAMM|nr:DEAD/DEAH box helicase family protein [Pseudidiomarina aestuarii]RUO39213.1 DEAD/DEAH box helicase [Pseudidiomarina aestuarii]
MPPINFSKRLNSLNQEKPIEPQLIYEGLDRESDVGRLRSSQADVLERWFQSFRHRKDNIIKMHTGEGKTLVGLLLLQSRLIELKLPALYICPNKYLARQVIADASRFGIQTCSFDEESSRLPDEFLDASKILVTYVQKVFNGRSVFKLDKHSVDIGAVVLDDSHSCIDSIKEASTIKLKKNEAAYKEITKIFREELQQQGAGTFLDITSNKTDAILPIPYWAWKDKYDAVLSVLHKYSSDGDLRFTWPLLRDRLELCSAYLSSSSLEISCSISVIDRFGSFNNARSRILMSATTQDDAFFIKGLGFEIESVLNPIEDKTIKWSGEKAVIIPQLISDELDQATVVSTLLSTEHPKFGLVALVPSFKKAEQYKKLGAILPRSEDMYEAIDLLKKGKYEQTLVFANRYDGIDLPDNSCRLLILDGKPFAESLADRYEETCVRTSDVINVRISQRIEQGLGRGVRGEKDFCIIVITNPDLVAFIKGGNTSKYFSSQTLQQIEIGKQIAQFAQEDSNESENPIKVLFATFNQILNRDEDWKSFYVAKMDEIQNDEKTDDEIKIIERLNLEREAEIAIANQDFEKGAKILKEVIKSIQNNDDEKGWLMQKIAFFLVHISRARSIEAQQEAYILNNSLLKPPLEIPHRKLQFGNTGRYELIRKFIKGFSSKMDLRLFCEQLLDSLSWGADSEKFELAVKDLGTALGFKSRRPEKEDKAGPDNLWCADDQSYFLIECKNQVKPDRSAIYKSEAAQFDQHIQWFNTNYNSAQCTKILIIPAIRLSHDAFISEKSFILREKNLVKLKSNFRAFIGDILAHDNPHQISDDVLEDLLNSNQLKVIDFKQRYVEPVKRYVG